MPLLQMIAACGSELNKIVFHSGPDSEGYANALKMLDDLSSKIGIPTIP